jgi:LAGLIDADG endonuclease
VGKAVGGNAVIERRIAAAQGLSAADGHAFAGLVDAEGCFQIRPNNGGRSWSCFMTLAVRLDDAGMLVDLCRVTGLGRIRMKAAQGSSRPQACWTVASKRECAELARLLRSFPLRARKRLDFEIWSAAVDRWSTSAYTADAGAAFDREMARAAAALRRVRRYVKSPPPALDGAPEDLLAYLGGFFSGEGSFGLSALQPRAVVKLRRDDRAILELFAERFGLGSVRDHAAYGPESPSATWLICATDELGAAVRVFELAQLRGRKSRQFEAWREAAEERVFARLAGRRWDRARVQRAAERLAALRVYRQPDQPPATARAEVAAGDAREAYIGVLRAFARELPDAKLTCTAYARARAGHPEWPTRNTLTLAFGTWEQALAAAGLGSRASAWRRARD